MSKKIQYRRGISRQKRIYEVNRIYDMYARSGLSNRAIWARYIYPVYGITERTFYNMLKASADDKNRIPDDVQLSLNFDNIKPYQNPFEPCPNPQITAG